MINLLTCGLLCGQMLIVVLSDGGEAEFCSWYAGLPCGKNYFRCLDGERCIGREKYCNNVDDCGDNSDEKYCNTKDCPEELFRSCRDSKNRCIPKNWFCDGHDDCGDNSDETSSYCRNYTSTTNQSSIALRKIEQWHRKQRNWQVGAVEKWGTNVDTLALILYHASWKYAFEMTDELTIRLQSRLLSTKMADIPTTELASYVNPFLATCVDPRNFNGHNIIQELRNRVDKESCVNPYVFLSLCNAGETITEIDKKKLEENFENKHQTVNSTGMQAIIIMALACANKQSENEVDSEKLRAMTLELKQQYRNRTVVDLPMTAFVMQALIAAGSESDPDNFDEKKAFQEIIRNQKSDGSFGDLMSTFLVTPVLNCKSLADINWNHCEPRRRDGPGDGMPGTDNNHSFSWYQSDPWGSCGENEHFHMTSTGEAKFCSWYDGFRSKDDGFCCLNGEGCIVRDVYCNVEENCADKSDEKYCHRNDCPEEQLKSCRGRTKKCIPKDWFCDGRRDCDDNSDEDKDYCKNYRNMTEIMEQSWNAVNQVKWFTNYMGSNADRLALIYYYASRQMDADMTKELTIRLQSRLLSTKLADIPTTVLTSYVNPFLVACVNPRNFYGHNIIQELRNRVDKESCINPYVLLSLCNAGVTITESDKKKLRQEEPRNFETKQRTDWIGKQAIMIMALACANRQSGNEVDSKKLRVMTLELKTQYGKKAVFDLPTTALVMQALIAAGSESDPDNFDEKKAFQEIIRKQTRRGSFGDLMSTFLVTPVLTCRCLADINSNHCTTKSGDGTADAMPTDKEHFVSWFQSGS